MDSYKTFYNFSKNCIIFSYYGQDQVEMALIF